MKRYFSTILLAASFFGFAAMADIPESQGDQIVVLTANGDLQIQSNYPCPPTPKPRPHSIGNGNIIETMGWGWDNRYERPQRCYTNGERCPGGYSESVRYCWDGGWYRCGYQCEDIYLGGGDGGGGAGCQSTDPM